MNRLLALLLLSAPRKSAQSPIWTTQKANERYKQQSWVRSASFQPTPGGDEPERWFHNISRQDGTPFSQNEVSAINALTGKK